MKAEGTIRWIGGWPGLCCKPFGVMTTIRPIKVFGLWMQYNLFEGEMFMVFHDRRRKCYYVMM